MAKDPFKTMFKGVSFKKNKFHRPEGAGNFDNMDDYNIVQSINANEIIGQNARIGAFCTVSGAGTVAMGNIASATGKSSMAMGYIVNALGDYSTCFGANTTATNTSAFACGTGSDATGLSSAAFNSQCKASGAQSFAINAETTASGEGATSMGYQTTAVGDWCVAMGNGITNTKDYSLKVGGDIDATGGINVGGEATFDLSGGVNITDGTSYIEVYDYGGIGFPTIKGYSSGLGGSVVGMEDVLAIMNVTDSPAVLFSASDFSDMASIVYTVSSDVLAFAGATGGYEFDSNLNVTGGIIASETISGSDISLTGDIHLKDNKNLYLGDGDDASMFWDGIRLKTYIGDADYQIFLDGNFKILEKDSPWAVAFKVDGDTGNVDIKGDLKVKGSISGANVHSSNAYTGTFEISGGSVVTVSGGVILGVV